MKSLVNFFKPADLKTDEKKKEFFNSLTKIAKNNTTLPKRACMMRRRGEEEMMDMMRRKEEEEFNFPFGQDPYRPLRKPVIMILDQLVVASRSQSPKIHFPIL